LQGTKLRKRLLGQFYTPLPIVRLIARLAINSSEDRILDPAAGDGVFVDGAYGRLLELGASSVNARKQIVGIEIDQETYSRAKERLSGLNILNEDFFESSLGKFDVILGNPPYIEQREISRKFAIRNSVLLSQKNIKINARAGIYAYFIMRSATLLNENGILCFVVSSSWLDSVWGTDLQNFILDNFVVQSIIAFSRDIFKETMVETVILLLKKSKSKRARNAAKIILLKKKVDIDRIVEVVQNPDSCKNDSVNVIVKRQADLQKITHWSETFRERLVHRKLLQNGLLVPLQNIAEVEYCFKEGAYDFFVLSENDIRKLGVEGCYLKPVISSPTYTDYYNVLPTDIKERILLVDEPKSKLKGTRVLQYIEGGENRKIEIKKGVMRGKEVIGFNNLPTFRFKKLWYSLKRSSPCPILVPAFIRNRFFGIRNDAETYATANFYGIRPYNEEHILPILAFLNSTLGALLIELKARTSMGRGLLDIRSYTLRSLPVPDFSKISPMYNAKLGVIFNRLCKAARKGRRSEIERIKVDLDDNFLNILGMTGKGEDILRSLEELRFARNKRSIAGMVVVE